MAASTGEAFWQILSRHGLTLTAQPVMTGAPWKAESRYSVDNINFFVYGGDQKSLVPMAAYATDGNIIEGRDSQGQPLYARKLDPEKLPSGLNIEKYLRSPLQEGNDLLYSLSGLPREGRFHTKVRGGKDVLVICLPKADETQLLNAAARAGLVQRNKPGASPVQTTQSGGRFIALEIPGPLMQSMMRVEGNHVRELSDAPWLSEDERAKLAEGGLQTRQVAALVVQHFLPPEKERTESYEPRKKNGQEPKAAHTLKEVADQLLPLKFTLRRDLRGGVQYMIQNVGSQAHKLLTEAQDGIKLRPNATIDRGYMVDEGDMNRLKALLKPEQYEDVDRIIPASLPNNFFKKNRVAFSIPQGSDKGYMYVASDAKTQRGGDALVTEMKSYGLPDPKAITVKRQTPPVVRLTLAKKVTEDLWAQANKNCRGEDAGPGELHATGESLLDAEARTFFGVGNMVATTAHQVAVVIPLHLRQPAARKPEEPSPEQRRAEAMEAIGKENAEHLLLVRAHRGEEQRYLLLWRSSESNLKNDKLGGVLRWLSPTQQVSDYGKQMTYEPKYLRGISVDAATYMSLRQSIEEMPLVDDKPMATKRVERRVGEYFDGCDRVVYLTTQKQPFEAALEHLKGRDVRLVNVIHPPVEEIDREIAKLNSLTIHDAVNRGRHMGVFSSTAARELEAVATHLTYAPEVQEKLRDCEQSLSAASAEGANAAREYQEALSYLEAYREWIATHQSPKPGYVTQLVVMDATEKTREMFSNPEVKRHMTRLPDVWQGGDQKKSAMLLYPDSDMLERLRSELGGRFTRSFTKSDKGMEMEELQRKIHQRHQSEEGKASYATPSQTAEAALSSVQGQLSSMGDHRPWLMMEKPESSIKGERKIEDQPVLVFRTPPLTPRNRKKIEGLLQALEPFMKPRLYFGETILKMPELSADEQRYLEFFNERNALQKERANLEGMFQWITDGTQYNYYRNQLPEDVREDWVLGPSDRNETVKTRLQQRITELAGRIGPLLDEMAELEDRYPGTEGKLGTEHNPPTKRKPSIDEIIKDYTKLRDSGDGEEVASVKESGGRIFTLDGDKDRNGHENLEALLKEHEHPEFIKIYITPEMARACRKHFSSKPNQCFMNSSQGGEESGTEGELRKVINDISARRLGRW